jgi:hypothetical protein
VKYSASPVPPSLNSLPILIGGEMALNAGGSCGGSDIDILADEDCNDMTERIRGLDDFLISTSIRRPVFLAL